VDASVVWAAIGAIGSVAAAGVAAWAAHQSRLSAERANAAASALAAIEEHRRHDELTPDFEITCTAGEPDGDSATLYVMLKPGGLERLDEVTITILDGSDHWRHALPDSLTQVIAERFVWGPWEFNAGTHEQVESNKVTRPRPYSVVTGKNWGVLSLTRTQPGRWMESTSQEDWRKRQAGKPVRLLLTCRRDGYWPWLIQRDVEVTEPPRVQTRSFD
jgi:hypothetical protein